MSERFLNAETHRLTLAYFESINKIPNQEEFETKCEEVRKELPMYRLREKRNKLLTESDWTQVGDVDLASKEEWKTYRQALRDLPSVSVDAAYDENGNLINVEYPQKPE